ncbi:MAG: YciI family protein [bacterium]
MEKKRYCYQLKLFPVYFDQESWKERENNILSDHFNYLKNLTEEGVAILAGRTVNEPMTESDFGICIFEATSKEDAQKIMDNDPAIINKIMYAELYDFSLALLRK